MIPKQDILDHASEWQLRPDVVEKDYVLGWLLAVIGGIPETNTVWIFKGGTCIKKCLFETYRFSEDLDFSLLPDAAYTDAAIKDIAMRIASQVQESSGIELPLSLVEVKAKQNKQRKPTFQIRLSYRGPLGGPSNLPRVLFDITQYEPVIDSPVRRPILHSYPDRFPDNTTVSNYSFNELLAEKTRALLERTRPRDLYDVVYLLDNQPEAFDLSEVRRLLQEKCEVKGIQRPTCEGLRHTIQESAELRTEWKNMLGHQLPHLPGLDQMLERLPDLLAWIDESEVVLPAARLTPAVHASSETLVAPTGISYWGNGSPLEKIRFAGANHLLIEFDYHGERRRAEPYSFRQAGTKDILLCAQEVNSLHIEAFNLTDIQNVQTTNDTFSPRYRIEFTSLAAI
jgi:predicted nucleotidyltransferase component of viral defense system